MATIRVDCPTCAAILELDAAHRGQEVECGSCEAVFVAKARANPAAKPLTRVERDDDDDDKDEARRERKRAKRRAASRRARHEEKSERTHYGDAGLTLGFVSILLFWCPMVGPPVAMLGIVLSAIGMKSAYPGTATLGLIMNILMFVFSLLILLVFRQAANQAAIMGFPLR